MNDTNAINPPIGGEMPPLSSEPDIVPPIGAPKRRGRPPKALSLKNIAAMWHVSVRNLERAKVVLQHGVPELISMVDRGELKLGPAEYVARWPQNLQRECCIKGADYLRALIPLVRRAQAEEMNDA